MKILSRFERLHLQVRSNRWMHYFTIFTRIALAAGFLPSGFVKIKGERFTALATNHPMGSFLEAFYHTDYYYTMVGLMQVTAAVLLLIPRTALLGVLIYFPIILNICILSLAVRFDGSWLTSPLMVIACLYLLAWDWHRLKFIFFPSAPKIMLPSKKELTNRFPFKFFAGAALIFFTLSGLLISTSFSNKYFMPRNEVAFCKKQCPDSANPEACLVLCDCVHAGRTYNFCMEEFRNP